jgi:adenosylcobinamide amidohydrolase
VIRATLARPWLIAELPAPMRCLSWAPFGGGYRTASRVLWREVRNADLTEVFDAIGWFAAEMRKRGERDSIGMLTSRDIGLFRLETASSGQTNAACLTTVGLSNGERVGHRLGLHPPAGTINLLAVTDAALTDTALVEALSIATEARTAAVMDHGPDLPVGRATGTGTDCVTIAAPQGDIAYAGLHTEVGEALGRAVYDAVAAGTREWMATEGAKETPDA